MAVTIYAPYRTIIACPRDLGAKAWICGHMLAGIAGSNSVGACMSATCKCWVFSDVCASCWTLVQRSSTECVPECDCEAPIMRGVWTTTGCCVMGKKAEQLCSVQVRQSFCYCNLHTDSDTYFKKQVFHPFGTKCLVLWCSYRIQNTGSTHVCN